MLEQLIITTQIVLIDIVMAADNAIIIGLIPSIHFCLIPVSDNTHSNAFK